VRVRQDRFWATLTPHRFAMGPSPASKRAVRQQIMDEGALPVIPSRDNAIKKAYCPKHIYRRRYKIENYFCRIKDWWRIVTRYDKLARNFLATAAPSAHSTGSNFESRPSEPMVSAIITEVWCTSDIWLRRPRHKRSKGEARQ
jgi:hypothetical protein